jgi:hypothetical protein
MGIGEGGWGGWGGGGGKTVTHGRLKLCVREGSENGLEISCRYVGYF